MKSLVVIMHHTVYNQYLFRLQIMQIMYFVRVSRSGNVRLE